MGREGPVGVEFVARPSAATGAGGTELAGALVQMYAELGGAPHHDLFCAVTLHK